MQPYAIIHTGSNFSAECHLTKLILAIYFLFGKILNLTLAKVLYYWPNFHWCKRPKLNTPSSNLVTLWLHIKTVDFSGTRTQIVGVEGDRSIDIMSLHRNLDAVYFLAADDDQIFQHVWDYEAGASQQASQRWLVKNIGLRIHTHVPNILKTNCLRMNRYKWVPILFTQLLDF